MGNLMSNLKVNDLANATGGIPTVKGQKLIPTAWINFNGTGAIAIRDSEGVSSITDGGAGIYTVNFATAMANVNYVIHGSAGFAAGNPSNKTLSAFPSSTSSAMIDIYDTAGTVFDAPYIGISIMGGQA
mgnify:FL=1